jgi:hypothetical protein
MFSLFTNKNSASYYNTQKIELLKLVDQNIKTFQNIIDSHSTKNIKTITIKFNKAHKINIDILRRIGELKIQFRKTIGALPIVSTLPNSAKVYITINNNKYRFTDPNVKVKHMSKILTNLSAENAKNKNAATKKIAAAKVITNAAAKKISNNAAAAKVITNTADTKAITNAATFQLAEAQNLRKELNNVAVTNTVRQQLGTNGGGAPPNMMRSHMQRFVNNRSGVTINPLQFKKQKTN